MRYLICILISAILTTPAIAFEAYLSKYDRNTVSDRLIRSRNTSCMNCGNSIFCGDMYGNVDNKMNLKKYCESQNTNKKISLTGARAEAFGADGNKQISYSAFTRLHKKLEKAGDKPKFYYVRDNKDFRLRSFKDEVSSFQEYLNFLSSGNREGRFDEPVAVVKVQPDVIAKEPIAKIDDLAIQRLTVDKVSDVVSPVASTSMRLVSNVTTVAKPSADDVCGNIKKTNNDTSSNLYKECSNWYKGFNSLSACYDINAGILKIRSGIVIDRNRRNIGDISSALVPAQDPIIENGYRDRIIKPSAEYTKEKLNSLTTQLSSFNTTYTECVSPRPSVVPSTNKGSQ